jgi:hypothetical protein
MKHMVQITLTLIIALLALASLVTADVPRMINYQGRLTDTEGKPVPDSTYVVTFRIYDDSTFGATLLWDETDTVTTQQGLFSVILGRNDPIPDSMFSEISTYLGIQLAGQGEMYPRTRLIAVAYAYHALRSEIADTSEYALSAPPDDDWTIDTSGFNIYRMTGNVGIGTFPQYKLDVAGTAQMTGFKMPTDANAGYVLTSDASGIGTWQAGTFIPADYSVSQAKLKTATGEVSGTANETLELPGGEYCFSIQGKAAITGTDSWYHYGNGDWAHEHVGQMGTSYKTLVCVSALGGATVYVRARYVTSSGKDHWIFFLLDRGTGRVIGGYQAPDHPSYGSGGDEDDIPHPFGSYDPAKHEVILIDNEILPELKSKVTSKRSLLTVINEDYEIDFNSHPVYKAREIIEIDEYGDKRGEIIAKIETPEWVKILIGKDEIYLKRRLVETLPSYILYKNLKPKSNAESPIFSKK